jgi:hypothetical protein
MRRTRAWWWRGEDRPLSVDEPEADSWPANDQMQALEAANAINSWACLDTGLYDRIVPALRRL